MVVYKHVLAFVSFLCSSQKSPATQKRISNIIDYMMFKVFNYAVQGLYEADKLTFTLLLALKIDLQSKKVKKEEFDVLIKGRINMTNACAMF